VRYEWDEDKDRRNQQKHRGISFDMAIEVFGDDKLLLELDRVDEDGEQRWYAIGAVRAAPEADFLLFVVHVYRENQDGEEIIRIISARRASNEDVRRYQEQEVD
jgi:uncharacterized DUF497 family protein